MIIHRLGLLALLGGVCVAQPGSLNPQQHNPPNTTDPKGEDESPEHEEEPVSRAPKDAVLPCRAPYGARHGCSYCEDKYAMKPSPLDKTPIKEFSDIEFASDNLVGYQVWFSIPPPEPGCKTLIIVETQNAAPAFGTSGVTIIAADVANCYGGSIKSRGYGVAKCCGNEECSRAAAGLLMKSNRDKPKDRQDKPNSHEDKPDSQTDKPDSQTDKPDSHKDNPDSQTDKPDSQTDKPDSHKDNPDSHKDNPDSQKDNPDSHKDNPDSQKDKPESQEDENAGGSRDIDIEQVNADGVLRSRSRMMKRAVFWPGSTRHFGQPVHQEQAKKQICKPAVKKKGGPSLRAGPQQVIGTALACGSIGGTPACHWESTVTKSRSHSYSVSDSKTHTKTTGGSLAITAGFQFGFLGTGPNLSATGTVSHDESDAIEKSLSRSDEESQTDSLTIGVYQAPNTMAKLTFVPIEECFEYTMTCEDGDHDLEYCQATKELDDHAYAVLVYTG